MTQKRDEVGRYATGTYKLTPKKQKSNRTFKALLFLFFLCGIVFYYAQKQEAWIDYELAQVAEPLSAIVEVAEARDDRDNAQKIGDQIAALTRQLEQAEKMRATFIIQEHDAQLIVSKAREEQATTQVLIDNIKQSIQGLTDSIITAKVLELNQ